VVGGIEAQTVHESNSCRSSRHAHSKQAQVIKNIAVILEEAGTSWDYVMKTTVFLANMSDYTAMNEVYAAMLPSLKPARTAVEVGKLPGNFLIEVEAIAAIPDS
jgi:reactive intermediate/imine deaminase